VKNREKLRFDRLFALSLLQEAIRMSEQNEDNEKLMLFYERYVAQREKLHDAVMESSGRYGKAILALSGGGIALTVTFIEKIAAEPSPESIKFIILSWAMFLISLVSHLFSLRNSNKAATQQILILDKQYRNLIDSPTYSEGFKNWKEPVNKYSGRTRFFSSISIWALILGIVFVFVFSAVNLYEKGENMSGHNKSGPSGGGKSAGISRNNESQTPSRTIKESYIPPTNEQPPPPPPPNKDK
jgi:hypothetical protein